MTIFAAYAAGMLWFCGLIWLTKFITITSPSVNLRYMAPATYFLSCSARDASSVICCLLRGSDRIVPWTGVFRSFTIADTNPWSGSYWRLRRWLLVVVTSVGLSLILTIHWCCCFTRDIVGRDNIEFIVGRSNCFNFDTSWCESYRLSSTEIPSSVHHTSWLNIE